MLKMYQVKNAVLKMGYLDYTREGCPVLPDDVDYMKGWNQAKQEFKEFESKPIEYKDYGFDSRSGI